MGKRRILTIDPAIRRASPGFRWRGVGQRARRGLHLAGIDRMGVPAPWVPGARAGGPGDRRGYDEGRPRYYSRILLVCLTILIKSNTPRSLQPELSNCPIPVTRWICHITRNIPRNTGYRVHRLGRPAAYRHCSRAIAIETPRVPSPFAPTATPPTKPVFRF